jgi:hypothetical protein
VSEQTPKPTEVLLGLLSGAATVAAPVAAWWNMLSTTVALVFAAGSLIWSIGRKRAQQIVRRTTDPAALRRAFWAKWFVKAAYLGMLFAAWEHNIFVLAGTVLAFLIAMFVVFSNESIQRPA